MTLGEIPGGIACAGIGISYLTGFFLLLKASSFQIGLISAIPAGCSLAAILGGYLFSRLKRRRFWVISLLAVYYLSYALLGAIPFLLSGYSSSTQVIVALAVLTAAYAHLKIQEVFWYPWASEIIPEGQRGSFFGRLMITVTIVMMPFSYIAGRFLDRSHDTFGFMIVFGAAAVVGPLTGLAYMRIPDTRCSSDSQSQFHLKGLLDALNDTDFRKFLFFAISNAFATGICGPFTTVFMIETLHLPYTWIAVFGILQSLFFIVSVVVWGYIVDKYGSRPILLLCSAPCIFLYSMWIFNAPGSFYLVPLVHALTGICSAGVGVALQNQLMGVSTGKRSVSCLSLYQALTGIVGFIAPLLGGAIVSFYQDFHLDLLGYDMGKYQALFAAAGVISILPMLFIMRLKEPRGKPALYILRSMMVNPLKLSMHLFAYHRSFGEKERLNATVGLGSTGSPMVIGELINTLDDPIYFVRREAALALGRIGDRDAVMPLLAKLSDENANIQHEAAWALGSIRDGQSINPLLDCLRSPDPKLRGFSATALGEIGASVAIEPLLERLDLSSDTFETSCVANALSRLGYKKALWKTLEKLVSSDLPIVRRQLSVSLGDLLGEQGKFYRLLNREERVYGLEVRRLLSRMGRTINRRWKPKLGEATAGNAIEGFKRIEELYGEKKYPEALDEIVSVSNLLLGQEMHRYNPLQETVRRFLHELKDRNKQLGNRVYWEECLVSIYALSLLFEATQV